MFNNSWFKKEMSMRGLTGFGGGATGFANAGGDAWEEAGITATGGTIHNNQANPDGTPYTWHVFPGGPRGPNTNLTYDFDVSAVNGPGKFEYIMVAGGGIGGISPNPDPGGNPYKGAGGGGAGGVICNFQSPPAQDSTTYHPFYPVSPGASTASVQAYPISVGRAAAGNPAPERQGKNTTFLGLTAVGGGYGGHANSGSPAGPGGSGGGGGAPPGDQTGASGTTNQGKAGGDGETASGGGGGGAETGGGGASGAGGEGIEFPDAGFFKLSVGGIADNPASPGIKYLAGGGGGGGQSGDSGNPPGKGGFGGGGDSNNPGNNPGPGGSADNWSGGGGGGAGGGTNTTPGGHGGQGMVFIRYIKN